MADTHRETGYNCAPLDVERLRQSAEKIDENAALALPCAAWQKGIQLWAADTIEAQAEELAQKEARIARLEEAIDEPRPKAFTDWLSLLNHVLNESPRQSLATVKAEALREFGDNQRDEPAWIGWARVLRQRAYDEANRLEREAKE